MTPVQLLLNFAKDLANNYDCECNGDSDCQACKAEAVIREVLGDKAESLLRGPYYGAASHVVQWLKDAGRPTDHLTFGESIVTKEDVTQEHIDELRSALAEAKAATPTRRWELERETLKAVPGLLAEIASQRRRADYAVEACDQARGQRDALRANFDAYRKRAEDTEAELRRLCAEARAERDRLREALRPFADEALRRSWIRSLSAASGIDEVNIGGSALINGDLRRAAEALGLLSAPAKED